MKHIVVINGTGGSGKDTFVNFVKKYRKVYNFSSIDIIKKIARAAGWTGKKEEKDRKFLSDLKKLTTEYNDLAFNDTKNAVEKFNSSDDEIMFIHIREPEEIQRTVDAFGAKTLLIKREGLKAIKTNYSDASVENYDYDFIIENTTLEELELIASTFYEKMLEKDI